MESPTSSMRHPSTNIGLGHAVSEGMGATVVSIRHSLDDFEAYSNSVVHLLKQKLRLMYETSIAWVDSIEHHDKLVALRVTMISKTNEFIAILRSHELHTRFQACMESMKSLLYKEVSRQALLFGCGGLLTGALIGICVGYTVRSGSNYGSLSNGSSSNYLMRAILTTNSRRGIDGITLSVIPTPKVVNSDDVVIQVRAAGIDMIDTEVAKGYRNCLRQHLGLGKVREPFVLGRECSGVVVDLGKQVQTLEINDRVWACVPTWASQGLMSEYVVVPEKYVALKPNNITFEAAATMPYAFITFWEKVVEQSQMNPQEVKNKRILIHLGLSSKNDGVGLLATQIFKAWGARVTISTEENITIDEDTSTEVAQMTFLHSLKTLGAESHLIIPTDHSQISNLAQRLFDIVVNTDSCRITPTLSNFCKNANDDVIETCPAEVHRYSTGICNFISSFLMFPYNFIFAQRNATTINSPNGILNECKRLVESRLIVPVVAKSFLPSQYDQAFRHVAKTPESALAQATVGKSVIVFKSTFK